MALYVYRVRKGVPGIGRFLARSLGAQELTSRRPKERIPEGSTIINYGRAVVPEWDRPDLKWVNTPESVAGCVNKLVTLDTMLQFNIPRVLHTTEQRVVREWLERSKVFVRHTVIGKKGRGIEILERNSANIPQAPLYTKHFFKTTEFRVHVMAGEVIDITQKRRMSEEKRSSRGIGEGNKMVRNRNNGWVFAHNNLPEDGIEQISQIAIDAADALGVTYCGVDILAKYDKNTGRFLEAVVCEVNSAPGMSKRKTKEAYITGLKKLCGIN